VVSLTRVRLHSQVMREMRYSVLGRVTGFICKSRGNSSLLFISFHQFSWTRDWKFKFCNELMFSSVGKNNEKCKCFIL